jgi:hypothetical protein
MPFCTFLGSKQLEKLYEGLASHRKHHIWIAAAVSVEVSALFGRLHQMCVSFFEVIDSRYSLSLSISSQKEAKHIICLLNFSDLDVPVHDSQ